MNIAILHYSAPPIIGGVEETMASHARLLVDRGYQAKIVAGRGEAFDVRVPVEIVPEVDSKHPAVLDVNRQLARGEVTPDFGKLVEEIKRALAIALSDVNVCIAHNILTLHKNLALSCALYDLAQEGRFGLIGWCHDFAWQDPVYAGEVHTGLPWSLLRQVWRGTRYVVVSHARQQELALLLSLPPAEIAVVPPGVEVCEFLGVGELAARWAGELDLLGAAPLLLLPARVTRRKNIELAVEITAALRALGAPAKLVVMGPLGPHNPANLAYLDELRDLRRARCLEREVLFLQEYDAVDDRTRRDLYLLADMLLFTSQREGFGIPILEAGLSRLPIFCADIPPFHESAGSAANYFALDEAPRSIAQRVIEFLANDSRYLLKQRVVKDYSWPRIFSERIEPLLKETDDDPKTRTLPTGSRGDDEQ